MGAAFTIAGRPAATASDRPGGMFSAISPDYFRVMQIPLLKGRELTEQDVETAPWVVVINAAMARKFWPNQDPIGQVITLNMQAALGEERPREIVGVVGNVRQFRLGEDPSPEIYAPYPQQAQHCVAFATEARLHKSLVMRTSSESKGLIDSVRRAVTELDKDSPVFGIKTVQETVSNSTNLERFYTQLLGGFAVVALLLAAIGIYGVISYSVSERRHEIGLRMALGAQSAQVLRLVLREGLILSSAGVAIGLAGSFGATPLLSKFLYGVKAHDPLTLTLVSLFLVGITILATYIPAFRATKVDPMVTLRHE
jgi:putative ABC transport system permease protein